MRYNLCFVIALLSILQSGLIAQTIDEKNIIRPVPIIGWDSLGKSINCPDFILHAGIQGQMLAVLEIDSLGKTFDASIGDFITIETFDTLRSESMRDCIRKYFMGIKWKSAMQNGKKIDYRLSIPLYFLFKEENQVDPIIVRCTKPHIDYYRQPNQRLKLTE